MANVQALTVTVEGNPFLDATIDTAKIILDWSSAAAGTVSLDICSTFATAQAVYSGGRVAPKKMKGYLRSIETAPGLSGNLTDNLPTANYDITLLDSYSYDVAGGNLNDRSGTAAESVVPSSPIFIDDEITLTIANAGDGTKGRIIMILTPQP